MSGLLEELKADFATNDKEYRHAYADESLNISIATQLKVLREQRDLTQEEMAREADMQQPMISRYENVDYSSWSINTLKKLAVAFDVWLDVRFRSFGELVTTVEGFSRESFQVPKFDDDPFFRETPTIAAENLTPTFGEWQSTFAAGTIVTNEWSGYECTAFTHLAGDTLHDSLARVDVGQTWLSGAWGAPSPIPLSQLTVLGLRTKKDIRPAEFREVA